jgi:hypothetical protein
MPNSPTTIDQPSATISELDWMHDSQAKLELKLVAQYGAAQRPRVRRGLEQVGTFWR